MLSQQVSAMNWRDLAASHLTRKTLHETQLCEALSVPLGHTAHRVLPSNSHSLPVHSATNPVFKTNLAAFRQCFSAAILV